MADESETIGQASSLGRRDVFRLGLGAIAAASVLAPEESLAVMRAPSRRLSMLNLHTGESLRVEYWVKGRYSRDALRQINRLLRDHRSDAIYPIDPKAIDILYQLTRKLGANTPIHIISGYRSPETNAMLRETSDGVAQFSYHMQGRAIDLRVPGRSLRQLQRAALSLRSGGVGYYPESNFVHVDTGPVRRW